MKLTAKQETFSKLVALDGLNPSEAYRQAYDTNPINQSSIHEQASKLMSNNKVKTRIKELSEAVTDKMIWNKAEIMKQLAINVEASRNVNQFAASNQALKLLGSAVGNVFEPETQQINVTAEILHKLPDTVLQQLESMVSIESGINDTGAIDADYRVTG